MTANELLSVFDAVGQPRVLVLGDLILDRYTWGNAERVSQEAPVILLRADRREARLGGAANVCNMLRGLEAEVSVAGVVGADADGQTLRRMLAEVGVDPVGLLNDPSRPTTVKERFIGLAGNRHPHQILRVDSEVRDPLNAELEADLTALTIENLRRFDVVLVSDYGKGVCTPRLVGRLIAAARGAGVPVLVDPIRGADYSRYRGATTMTPNRLEAELSTGIKIACVADAVSAGRKLCAELDLESAIVTLDRDGMVLVRPDGSSEHFPTRPREVYDITGAGDMVLATIGLCLGSGLSIDNAIRLANVAGGLEVEKVGVVPVFRDEIRRDLLQAGRDGARKILSPAELVRLAQTHRQQGSRIAFTNGCFDLLHVGHVTYLGEAAAQGDLLIVGVNSDRSVRSIKGPGRPVIQQHDRAAMLAALACVDYVTIFDDLTPVELLAQLRPDVLVKGGDYADRPAEVVGREIVEAYGGRVHLTSVVAGVSTTRILKSVAA
jgi:D-beta-D-heptose 7-phosphate kinase/D-beta-D-heptose 1-phosphate adenosyltransferase